MSPISVDINIYAIMKNNYKYTEYIVSVLSLAQIISFVIFVEGFFSFDNVRLGIRAKIIVLK